MVIAQVVGTGSGYCYEAMCTTVGSWNTLTGGSPPTGNVSAVDYVAGLTTAVLSVAPPSGFAAAYYLPGLDAEIDGPQGVTAVGLRGRYFNKVNMSPFGGNWADYFLAIMGQIPVQLPPATFGATPQQKTIQGVGGVQIYPCWQGGGSVLCSIVDAGFLFGSVLGTAIVGSTPATGLVEYVQNIVDPIPGLGYGVAPAGATVTIVPATSLASSIVMTLTLASGYGTTGNAPGNVLPGILASLNTYLSSLQQAWGNGVLVPIVGMAYSPVVGNTPSQLLNTIVIADLLTAAMSVPGVLDVTGITYNGNAGPTVALTETTSLQQIPALVTTATAAGLTITFTT